MFVEANAGPYRLFVTVRPPLAIPGVADVEVLATSDDVREVRIVPLPLTGPAAKFAPVPDRAQQSTDDQTTLHRSLVDDGRRRLAGARDRVR